MNRDIANKLREAADLLELQGAEAFRVRAYRRAADTVGGLDEDVSSLLEREGPEGLTRLSGVGQGIAGAIAELVHTGRWSRLERLRGELDAEKLLRSVPGIGPGLARRIHEQLHVDTLEALEIAAHDGSLEALPGIGRRRVEGIRAALAAMLSRMRGTRPRRSGSPPAALILDVDREYRSLAQAGKLRTIAPRRFNPEGRSWLPVLHTGRDGWHFSALYSNTARAHELNRTRDWVVVYYYDEDHSEGQCTVVTETQGSLRGQRVIRGREAECSELYARNAQA